jgi:hypothetical protein
MRHTNFRKEEHGMAAIPEHTFHIPVLGIGFSITTPLAVAKYGISSVMSMVDDTLCEDLRRHYLQRDGLPYDPIDTKEDDARARRITAYLNMVKRMVDEQFISLRMESFDPGSELHTYFELLPETSAVKADYRKMLATTDAGVSLRLQERLRAAMAPGSIDVNIMTKIDKTNYGTDGAALPTTDNDAHASLRGFALSDLESGVVFSAGMNPRLYGYIAQFDDFFPAADGSFRKKIIIKVSDFRSALIQGKFLAKKGLWVSEYRIESGLNCGGHAFATDGYLFGPILEEFKTRREELFSTVREVFLAGLAARGRSTDPDALRMIVTAQGGVGTAQEQEILLRRYDVQSVGWGSPFLLVPEATNVDAETRARLCDAGEDDIYLSNVSPLGVPFNNLRGNSKDQEKADRIEAGRPGSPCTKKFLELNTEYSERPQCTASISFIKKKFNSLKDSIPGPEDFKAAYDKAMDKVCLCEGLVASARSSHDIAIPKISDAVSVCPGPNLAYFSRIVSLKEMVDHIYGRINIMTHHDRPNMFLKELRLYLDYFMKKIQESFPPISASAEGFFTTFSNNLLDGIAYYKAVLPDIFEATENARIAIIMELEAIEERIREFSFAGLVPA